MISSLRITALVENLSAATGVCSEWGLSLWIEADGRRILFDTGQGPSLGPNAARLGVDLATADALVLSHGHYDHTGGVASLFASGFAGLVYLHPAALEPKFKKQSPPKPLAPPAASLAALQEGAAQLVSVTRPTPLAPGILLSGEVERHHPLERIPGEFYLDEGCTRPDVLLDDLSMLIETARGWVVVTGCGHAGLINILQAARSLTQQGRIYAVVGGFHLLDASAERLEATAQELLALGVERIAPCHCTDAKAVAYLQQRLGAHVEPLHAGQSLWLAE